MRDKIELYWLHLAGTNPSPAFWQELAALKHVAVHAETDDQQNAEILVQQALDTPPPPDVYRIAFLHINDVMEIRGEVSPPSLEETPGLTPVFFSKAAPNYKSTPPILHYSRDVLPFLESNLVKLLQDTPVAALHPLLCELLQTADPSHDDHSSPEIVCELTDRQYTMIASQVHSASGRVSGVLRRIRRMETAMLNGDQSAQNESSWSTIVQSLEQAQELLDSVQNNLQETTLISPSKEE